MIRYRKRYKKPKSSLSALLFEANGGFKLVSELELTSIDCFFIKNGEQPISGILNFQTKKKYPIREMSQNKNRVETTCSGKYPVMLSGIEVTNRAIIAPITAGAPIKNPSAP